MLVTGRPCMKTGGAAAIVLFLLVLWTGAPEDGVSPTREALPSPGGRRLHRERLGTEPQPRTLHRSFAQGPDRSSKLRLITCKQVGGANLGNTLTTCLCECARVHCVCATARARDVFRCYLRRRRSQGAAFP